MFAILIAALLPAPAVAPIDTGACYDFALVGRIAKAGRILSTSDDLTHRTTWLGLIRRDLNLVGSVPKLSWMSVTMHGVPPRTTKFLLVVKKRPEDVPKVVRLENLPAGSSRSDWLRTLEATGLRRCSG